MLGSNWSHSIGVDIHLEQPLDEGWGFSDSQVSGAPKGGYRSLTTTHKWFLRSVNAVSSSVACLYQLNHDP